MGWGFWAILFLIFLLVTPVVQLTVGWARKGKAKRALERQQGTRVIPLILDLQTVATYGLPVARFEQLPLPNEVARAIRTTPLGRSIDLVVDLPGDVAFDMGPVTTALAERRANASAPATLIVPRRALTGGIALVRAADAVLLGPGAVLGGNSADGADQGADLALANAAAPPAATAAGACSAPRPDTGTSESRSEIRRLTDVLELGLPVEERLPTALPAYVARFKEPRRPAHRLPFYIAQPRSD
jgi:hypothetical protein